MRRRNPSRLPRQPGRGREGGGGFGRVVRGFASLAMLAALIGGVPAALARWGRLPQRPAGDWSTWLSDTAMSDTMIFAVLTLAVWVAWSIFTTSVLVEAVAGIRGRSAPDLIGAGMLQRLARALVVPVLMLLSVAHHPAAATAASDSTPGTFPASVGGIEVTSSPGPAPELAAPTLTAAATAPAAAAMSSEVVIVVEGGDDPWSLAERHLGDGMAWRELFEHNKGVVQADGEAWTDPQHLHPGWELRLPGTTAPVNPASGLPSRAATNDPGGVVEHSTTIHVVEDGDTLFELAAHYLGDSGRYLELFDANTDIVQPDGRRLRDPDFIDTGWQLVIPLPPAPVEPAPPPIVDEPPPPAPATTTTTTTTSTTMPPMSTVPPSTSETPAAQTDTTDEGRMPVPLLAGIAGSVVLATGLAARLRWLRHRRATRGAHHRAVATTRAEHAAYSTSDEPLVRWAGQRLAAVFHAIDHRRLSAGPAAVELSEDAGLEILWEAPQHATPPEPWTTADGGWAWRLAYRPDDDVPVDELPAVIPALVTIGERDGRQLLIDLEAWGTLTIGGAAEHAEAFARFVALELACGNDLADGYVTAIGLDLDASLAPRHRLTPADVDAAERQLVSTAESVGEVLAATGSDDTLRARCRAMAPIEATVVVAAGLGDEQLATLGRHVAPRRAVALVACTDAAVAGGANIEIDPSGRTARLEPLGIDFRPVSLPATTTAAVQEAVAVLLDLPDDPPLIIEVAQPDSSSDDGHRNGRHPSGGDLEARLRSAAYNLTDAAVRSAETDGANDGGGRHPLLSANGDETDTAEPTDDGRLFDPLDLSRIDGGERLLVRVLGVPRIDQRPEIGRRELILAVLLACRGGSLAATAVQDALWGGKAIEPKTMWNFVGKVRRALGEFDDGSAVMPAADRTRGQLRLDQRVTTDLEILQTAVADAETASSVEAIQLLRAALTLVEGPPFDAAGYDWAHRDQDVASAGILIERAVDRLVALALEAGQLDVARAAITCGLRGLPGDEGLYRARMRVEAAAGNSAGIVAAWDELSVYLADFETAPSAITAAYYHELIAQRPASSAVS